MRNTLFWYGFMVVDSFMALKIGISTRLLGSIEELQLITSFFTLLSIIGYAIQPY